LAIKTSKRKSKIISVKKGRINLSGGHFCFVAKGTFLLCVDIFRPQKSGNKKTETGFCNMTLCPGSALPVNPRGVAECAY
ncbi:hypothetical protein DSB53_20970, partial [Salmonella enterica subsp. enterica serovar Wangata]|nr:hypothetical protein [Salmonella enterica]EBR9221297.1 hypothetical protein [Salmonella enterica subsp. enterica serovar Wangata]EBS2728132.1 hypothetical protein [Salmonella enterica subsp. enterica serovar Wangata]EBW1789781.1 hypothetical protein [Salmonella enterica subsp. enterica serovar Wangata]